MLPSKGYFRSIDCPFYKNNLCHRFYCHFRHNKKENFISSRLELTDFINGEDNSEICQDVLQESMKNASNHEGSSKQVSEVIHSPTDGEKGASCIDIETTNKKKAYPLPADIPKYNPTPISELKIRYKQVPKTGEDNVVKDSDLNCNEINKTKICKDSNLIETLVDYFNENDSNDNSIGIKNVEKSVDSDVKSCVTKKTDDSQCITAADSTIVHKVGEEILPYQIIDSVVQENVKLKDMINQLKVMESFNEPKNEKVLDNETLLDDLMGICDNSASISNFGEINITKQRHFTIMEENGKNCKKHKWKKSIDPIIKQPRHNVKRTKLISSSKNQKCIINNKKECEYIKKSNCAKNYCKKKMKNTYTGGAKSDTMKKTLDTVCDNEVILISDSDDVDLTVVDNSITDESNEFNVNSFEDNLPEPKRKIRVSHVHNSSSPSQPGGYSYQEKTFSKSNTSSIENDCQVSKQKERFAHTLHYSTLSVQTVQDHLSHWESVKERVKNKCTNPSGEAGYQNWSKVKISPVPNVASLMNSKKLLYSRIHQWKSKASI